MKPISTRMHGVIDYLAALVLMAFPFLLVRTPEHEAVIWVPFALGGMIFVVSLFTRYELSISKAISMKMHLVLDVLAGIFLAASPWIFDFNEIIYLPHVILGVMLVIGALLTQTEPVDALYPDTSVQFSTERKTTAGTIKPDSELNDQTDGGSDRVNP